MEKELIYYSAFAISHSGIVDKMDRQVSCTFSIRVDGTETPDQITDDIRMAICEKVNRNSSHQLSPVNIEIKMLSLIETRMLSENNVVLNKGITALE